MVSVWSCSRTRGVFPVYTRSVGSVYSAPLNETDDSLKCPLCPAKHKLSDEGAGLLPVNRYALQELPLKRLQQQQREDNGGQQAECTSCGEQAPVVAWCEDCDAMICQQCVALHKKIASLRAHVVCTRKRFKGSDSESTTALPVTFTKCPRHVGQELKYLCTTCSELVCPECLLRIHKDHEYCLVEKARHSLETKMEELASLVDYKKEEFSEYLVKASKAESEALEYSELMKSEVNNVFDGIVASVEAQRNEALQSVSQEVKEIWSQKEMVEVSLAQLDSFTRFADHTHKCTADVSYVAMAAQSIKLMERLKNTHGDKDTLDQKKMVIGSKPLPALDNVFALGRPSFKFSPQSGFTASEKLTITVSLMVDKLPVNSRSLHERCRLDVKAHLVTRSNFSPSYVDIVPQVTAVQSPLSWQVEFALDQLNCELEITCQLTGDINTEKVTYTHTQHVALW